MLTEFVMISFLKPDVRKTLNNYITYKNEHNAVISGTALIYLRRKQTDLNSLAQKTHSAKNSAVQVTGSENNFRSTVKIKRVNTT